MSNSALDPTPYAAQLAAKKARLQDLLAPFAAPGACGVRLAGRALPAARRVPPVARGRRAPLRDVRGRQAHPGADRAVPHRQPAHQCADAAAQGRLAGERGAVAQAVPGRVPHHPQGRCADHPVLPPAHRRGLAGRGRAARRPARRQPDRPLARQAHRRRPATTWRRS